jgi:hypothetical protein
MLIICQWRSEAITRNESSPYEVVAVQMHRVCCSGSEHFCIMSVELQTSKCEEILENNTNGFVGT